MGATPVEPPTMGRFAALRIATLRRLVPITREPWNLESQLARDDANRLQSGFFALPEPVVEADQSDELEIEAGVREVMSDALLRVKREGAAPLLAPHVVHVPEFAATLAGFPLVALESLVEDLCGSAVGDL